MQDLHERIRIVLSVVTAGAAFDDAQDLFVTGLVRSLHLMELVTAIEDAFHIEVVERELHERRLRSVDQIRALIVERVQS